MTDDDKAALGLLVLIAAGTASFCIYKHLTAGKPSVSPLPPDPPIDLTFASTVTDELIKKLGLLPLEEGELGRLERHQVFFIHRRAIALGLADANLREGPGLTTLKQQLEAELKQVKEFISAKIGTESGRGPYFGEPGDLEKNNPEARHLELGKVISPRLSDPPGTTELAAINATKPTAAEALTLTELDRRRLRAISIVWRAAAIDPDVWSKAGSSTLRVDELSELLDRRQRSVERLRYEACAGATPAGIGSSFIDRRWSTANKPSPIAGPWKDDLPIRMFEAPSIPRNTRSADPSIDPNAWVLTDFVGTSGIIVELPSHPRFALGFSTGGPTTFFWYHNFVTDEYDWNVPPGTRTGRNATDTRKLWEVTPSTGSAMNGYGWVLKTVDTVKSAADILRRFFESSDDFWERAWLHSDGVISALHLEALKHAKFRRTLSHDLFDQLPKRFSLALDDYFEIRAHAVKAPNGIMQAGRTDHFENDTVPIDDLQVGDQVLFEMSPVVTALGATAWEYPTVLVTDVDTHPFAATVSDSGLRVQGFGSVDLNFGTYQLLLAKNLDATLKMVQDHIPAQIERLRQLHTSFSGSFTPPKSLDWDSGRLVSSEDTEGNDSSLLRFWNPYNDTWDDPGPWWIWINIKAPMWRGIFGDDAVDVLGRIPGGFVQIDDQQLLPEFLGRVDRAATISIGPGFQEPPWQDRAHIGNPGERSNMIFVPLFEPEGGWMSYFFDKAANPALKFNSRLRPVKTDGRWLPGLAERDHKIRVIRPRLEKAK